MPQFSVSLDKVVEKLRLEVVYTPTELKNIPIYTADVNRPGLLLTGYDEYFDPTRQRRSGLSYHAAGKRTPQPYPHAVRGKAACAYRNAQPFRVRRGAGVRFPV